MNDTKKHTVKENCEDCGGEGSWDSTPFPNYIDCESCDGKGEHDVVLTEFFVTETYVIKAKSLDEANDMVANNEFEHGINNYNSNVEPNKHENHIVVDNTIIETPNFR
tara:strand:- start:102 stop:425 length:324 start_codon:yes stop_codon:yes gene_type:complete